MLQPHFCTRPLARCGFYCLLIAFMCASCSGLSPRERQQRQLVAKLDSSIKRELVFINEQTLVVRRALEDRLLDAFSAERAKIWQPVAETVQASAKTATNQINELITKLDTEQAYTMFAKGPWSDSLYYLLARFRQVSLHAHEQLLATFEHTILPHEGFDPIMPKDDTKKSLQQDFAYLTNDEAKTLLRYWQKEVAVSTNKLVTFCFYQIPNSFCGINFLTPLVSQSQNILAPGETLTITAGIGSYTSRANPTIYVNKKSIPLVDNAVGYYKLKVGQKKGKYTIPIITEYLDANGIKTTSQINIEYTVQ